MKKLLNIAAVLIASLVLFASCANGDINPEVSCDVTKFLNGYGNVVEDSNTGAIKANDDGTITIQADGSGAYTQAALDVDFAGAKSVYISYNAKGNLTVGFIADGERWSGRIAGSDQYITGDEKDAELVISPIPAGAKKLTVGANGDDKASITIKEVIVLK